MSAVHAAYRPRHGLTAAAVEVFDRARYAILGTENPDGSVHIVPVMFRLDDGRILIQTSATTRKARNVARSGRATVLGQDPKVNGEGWVSGSGPAELVHGPEAQQLGHHLRARYLTELGERELGQVMALYDDTAIVVTPDQWMAWDTSAYTATLVEHGVPLDHADRWYQ
jgi:PPOX class probable F420-dependent enzyme